MKIQLYNRDGADLYLFRLDEAEPIEPNIYEWELCVDEKHSYVLEYCRFIGQFDKNNGWEVIEAIDPSGGPMLYLGDEFKKKYKIVKINSVKSIWISERNQNN